MQEKVNYETNMASPHDDEINLFDLWDDILQEKLWVILGIFGCIGLAVVYLLLATPVYETKVVVKPVSANNLVELNVPQLQGIYSKSVDEAFSDARAALLSKEYRRQFYQTNIEEIKLVKGAYNKNLTEAQNFIYFDKLFTSKVSSEKKDIETYLQVNLQLSDPEQAAGLLNSYTEFTLAAKLADVKETVSSKITAQVEKLEYDARNLKERYDAQQIRRQILLEEALEVSIAINQTKPLFSTSEIVGSFEPPLYMAGTQALKTELDSIKKRKERAAQLPFGENQYVDGLPELLFKIDQLKNIDIDFSRVSLAVIDESAIEPVEPVKPKKMLIVVLACVAGLLGGLMLALIMAAHKRHKENVKNV